MSKKKQQPFMFSIDPVLYKRSHEPSTTIAMGMKPSEASSHCWVDQVTKERTITTKWERENDPAGLLAANQAAALDRTLAVEAGRREAYLSREGNPHLHSILYGSSGASASGGGCGGGGGTDSTATAVDVPATTSACIGNPNVTGAAPSTDRSGATAGGGGGGVAPKQRKGVKATEKYLAARRGDLSIQQQFPLGPMTTTQSVGWIAGVFATAAAAADTSDGAATATTSMDLYRPSGQRLAVQSYRKPEDEDHALLMGYHLRPSN